MAKLKKRFGTFWRAGLWHKVFTVFVAVIVLFVAYMYAIAQWYIYTEKSKPLTYGVSFIPDYAQSLGVDPQQTLDGLLSIGVKHVRFVSYWSDIETTQGTYDFSQLDWQFQKAEAAHAKVSLSLGLRQPRWPECHMPDWAIKEPPSAWQPQLESFMSAVVQRYKNSPSLDSYQVENEFFLTGFGLCEQIPGSLDRSRLVAEYNLVKKLDPSHTVIINRSNNALGWPAGDPKPDEYGISVYKRVWSPVVGRYMEYPIPAWYYGSLAGFQKIFLHRDMVIHELQAEAWAPNGQSLQDIGLAEQNKSLNAQRLKDRFGYGKATGMRTMDLWGAEYWYYRLTVLHDPSLWNVAKQEFNQQ
ncbi:MAG: hypothetical protein JWO41_762 [Candidatus Saccharibacteria bacterium]|nr:hypothetical protein [Candidatus Saccharibacteria bacterium]